MSTTHGNVDAAPLDHTWTVQLTPFVVTGSATTEPGGDPIAARSDDANTV
jgi:hypothetical protein